MKGIYHEQKVFRQDQGKSYRAVFIRRLIAEERMRSFRIVECDVMMHTVKELSFGFVVAAIQLFSLHVRKEGFADRVSIT